MVKCKRLIDLRRKYKVEPIRYTRLCARIIGKLFHTGLKAMYEESLKEYNMDSLIDDSILQAGIKAINEESDMYRKTVVADEESDPLKFKRQMDIDFGIPIVMLKGYYKHIFMKERFEVVYPEQKIIVRVVTPSGRKSPVMRYRLVIDKIIRNTVGDNYLYLDEVKTAARWGVREDRYLAIDEQTTSYMWACKQAGLDIAGVSYTVCLKPTSFPNLTDEAKKKKAAMKKEGIEYKYTINDYETPQEYLARIEIEYLNDPGRFIRKTYYRTPQQIDEFEKELYRKCIHFKNLEKMGTFKNTSVWECPDCDGYDFCKNGGSEESLMRWYTERASNAWDEENIITDY
jgi:hypothetical protein